MSRKIFKKNTDKKLLPIEGEPSPDVVFIAGAIRAAQNSSPKVRAKILADLSEVGGLDVETLRFLFEAANDHDDHAIYDFPDSERRRQIIPANRLDAAE